MYAELAKLPKHAFRYLTVSLRDREFQQLKLSGSGAVSRSYTNSLVWRYQLDNRVRTIKVKRNPQQRTPIIVGCGLESAINSGEGASFVGELMT